jgi:hypothetical protein
MLATTRTPRARLGRVATALALGLTLVSTSACGRLIAEHSLVAYTNATRLKAATLALVDVSASPYPAHADQARRLQVDLDAAYEFSRGTPYNSEAAAMWRIIRNPAPDRTLIGTFLTIWRESPGGLPQSYRTGKKANVALAFDRLICLEANKKERTKCPEMEAAAFAPAPDIEGSTKEPSRG